MTDQEREAELRTRKRYDFEDDAFLLGLLDAERQRVKKLEHALREGIRVVTMMEKALRSCQEIIDHCLCDICRQVRDTVKAALTTEAKP